MRDDNVIEGSTTRRLLWRAVRSADLQR